MGSQDLLLPQSRIYEYTLSENKSKNGKKWLMTDLNKYLRGITYQKIIFYGSVPLH